MPHRYFTEDINENTATLSGDDAHHLGRVMRAKIGDTVLLCGKNALEYTATITEITPDNVYFSVEDGVPSLAEPNVDITVYMGYSKQDKVEQIIQHGVELGAVHFVPFFSRYCVVKPKNEDKKNVRYNRIAHEAAKQAGRGCLPTVAEPIGKFASVCKQFENFDLVLFFYEGGGKPLRTILDIAREAHEQKANSTATVDIQAQDETASKQEHINGSKLKIALVTGAEGGFSTEEVELALSSGAEVVTLGKRILRCETAPLAALSAIMSHLDELD